ncbi:unnamed protein product, partial [Brassica rapa subsp. trilocularis]
MSYKMLPQYLHVLKLANPGTITDIKTKLDKERKSRFLYAFLSLKAYIDGWQHLRKDLVVDGTHMFGKYKGVLLSASRQDADCRIFPIAFAVILGSGSSKAFKVLEFQKIYNLINLTDWRGWDYLEKIDKKLWTRSHFEGNRYNLMSSNLAESLNKALLPARDSPIMALLEFIRRMLSRWFECRC